LLAGGSPAVAVRLGLAMVAIQFSIGALNDLVDAPRDHGRTPGKPVADGIVGFGPGRAIAVAAGVTGLALAAPSGLATLLVAAAGAACGYAYDLWLSRTAWSWLPLTIALPLVPVYAWLGVTGSLPESMFTLVPMAMLAGGGLAVGNALADLEADTSAAVPSIAAHLGRGAAWRWHALALGGALGLALVTLDWSPLGGGAIVVLAGGAAIATGVLALAGSTRPAGAAWARIGWGVEAVGVALLGIGWVLASAIGPGRGS
jgi:4-hydroxybenzoate polyprenyltransferase